MSAKADSAGLQGARPAGRHARLSVLRLRLRTLLVLGVLAVLTAFIGRSLGLRDPWFLASAVGLLVVMFVVAHHVIPMLDRRDRGARGEEQVGARLEELSDERWRVIHDASFGRGNVDHILVGPGGVFTVETKSHPGPVQVRRLHGETIRQVHAERKLVESITGLPVEPLLVFSAAWVDRPRARRKGVRVLPAHMLPAYLAERPARLSSEEIASAHGALEAALSEHEQLAADHGLLHGLERLHLARQSGSR